MIQEETFVDVLTRSSGNKPDNGQAGGEDQDYGEQAPCGKTGCRDFQLLTAPTDRLRTEQRGQGQQGDGQQSEFRQQFVSARWYGIFMSAPWNETRYEQEQCAR